LPELKKIVAALRKQWTAVHITVRMDAAFGSPELSNGPGISGQWLR
jgi:hypothetical protein